jgi:hypothetical protein
MVYKRLEDPANLRRCGRCQGTNIMFQPPSTFYCGDCGAQQHGATAQLPY